MKNQKYEQPSLAFVSVDLTDILLASGGGESETVGMLDPEYAAGLDSVNWNEVWGE